MPARRNSARTAEPSIARIYSAAEEEFGCAGYGRTNVDAIARRAGVSKELIYHYFHRKEQLYSETINRFGVSLWHHLLATDFEQADTVSVIRDFVARVEGFYRSNHHAARFLMDQVFENGESFRAEPRQIEMRKKLFTSLETVLARGRENGEIDGGMTPPRLFFLAVGLTIGNMVVASLMPAFALSHAEQRDGSLQVTDSIAHMVRRISEPKA